jgi:hypothetical protein
MARSTPPGLVLGAAALCVSVAFLLAGAEQQGCSFFFWMFPAILALQLCFALAAGYATGYRGGGDREPLKAGMKTNLIAALSGLILYALAGFHMLPAPCRDEAAPLGVLVVALVLTFFIPPVAVLAGAGVGWLGAQMARGAPR